MVSFIYNIANISAGIILGISLLDKLDGDSNFFNKISNFLSPFNVIIGAICIGIGSYRLITFNSFLTSITAISAGLILLIDVISKSSSGFGELLFRIARLLIPFKVVIGIAALVLGLVALIGK